MVANDARRLRGAPPLHSEDARADRHGIGDRADVDARRFRRRRLRRAPSPSAASGLDALLPSSRRAPSSSTTPTRSAATASKLKGAQTLRRLFTFVAIRVVQGHIEGLRNDGGFAPQDGWDGTSNCPDYDDLLGTENVDLGDGDEWISASMKKNPVVAMLEALLHYEEFDYDMLRECVNEIVGEGNVRLMEKTRRQAAGAAEDGERSGEGDRASGPSGGRRG